MKAVVDASKENLEINSSRSQQLVQAEEPDLQQD
jgi:hypothetical protein